MRGLTHVMLARSLSFKLVHMGQSLFILDKACFAFYRVPGIQW